MCTQICMLCNLQLAIYISFIIPYSFEVYAYTAKTIGNYETGSLLIVGVIYVLLFT